MAVGITCACYRMPTGGYEEIEKKANKVCGGRPGGFGRVAEINVGGGFSDGVDEG